MQWETIRKAGHIIEQSDLPVGVGMQSSRSFLAQMAKTFAASCVAYHDMVETLPFIYRERQINSVLLPAISKIADAVLAEHPVHRKADGESTHGWIDYWAQLGNFVHIIEVKHAWFAAGAQTVRKDHLETWATAIQQIRSISRSQLPALSDSTKHVVKIAMMVMPCYIGKAKGDALVPCRKEESEGILSTIVEGLSAVKKPNWSCLWALHRDLQGPFEYTERYELYPAVAIVASVDNSLSR